MRIFGNLLGLAVVAVLGTAASVSAKITQYECRFSQGSKRGGGWIPEILILTEDDVTGKIVAFDPIIKHFVGEPIEARLSERSKVRATFGWEIQTQNAGQSSRMIYVFSYFSNGRPAKMSAQPGGYRNTFSGEGTCKVSQS